MRNDRPAVTLCFLAVVTACGWAQEAPPWSQLRDVARADSLIRQGSTHASAEAFVLYRDAIGRFLDAHSVSDGADPLPAIRELVSDGTLRASEVVLPRAEAGLARIYYRDGAYDLSVRHYENAIRLCDALAMDGLATAYRYELADALVGIDFDRAMNILAQIIDVEDPSFRSDDFRDRLREAYRRALLPDPRDEMTPLENLLRLYRVDGSGAVEAHLRLAVSGGMDDGDGERVDHLVVAFLQIASTAIEELRFYEPRFGFEGLSALASQFARYDHIASYLREAQFLTVSALLIDALQRDEAYQGLLEPQGLTYNAETALRELGRLAAALSPIAHETELQRVDILQARPGATLRVEIGRRALW